MTVIAAEFTAEAGSVLLGAAGILSAALAWRQAVKAQRSAAEARAVSPAGALESLRAEVEAVLDAHRQTLARHQGEREGMEKALSTERLRADAAESRSLLLLGQIAGLRMDLASARAEINELRTRFEASLTR